MNSEAVNLAGSLVKVAGLIDREATGWGDYPRMAARCRQAVDQVTDAARYVLQTDDLVWGEAWLIEATGTLTHLQLARLFRDGTLWQKLDA